MTQDITKPESAAPAPKGERVFPLKCECGRLHMLKEELLIAMPGNRVPSAPPSQPGYEQLLAIAKRAHEWAAGYPLNGYGGKPNQDWDECAAREIYNLCEGAFAGATERTAPEVTLSQGGCTGATANTTWAAPAGEAGTQLADVWIALHIPLQFSDSETTELTAGQLAQLLTEFRNDMAERAAGVPVTGEREAFDKAKLDIYVRLGFVSGFEIFKAGAAWQAASSQGRRARDD